MHLVWPSEQYLPGCIAALERGWSSDSERGPDAVCEELQKISNSPARYLEGLVDREAKGDPVGLPYVEITTDPSNVASRKVIEANGGVLFEQFVKPAQFGGTDGLRYRIALE